LWLPTTIAKIRANALSIHDVLNLVDRRDDKVYEVGKIQLKAAVDLLVPDSDV
jgi:hypothetical protein